jgi:hypothetical protein
MPFSIVIHSNSVLSFILLSVYAEFCDYLNVMLSFGMLNVVMLTLCLLNGIMLSAAMLNVVAPLI